MNRNKLILIFSFLFNIHTSCLIPGSIYRQRDWVLNLTGGWNYSIKRNILLQSVSLIHFVKSGDKSDLINVADAEYYSAVAALKLFNPDAEYRMMMFISTHPESPRINEARLDLGNYFYQNKNYRKAVIYYRISEQTGIEI